MVHGAYALLMGQDPYVFLNQNQDDYETKMIILKKAMELDEERRTVQMKVLALEIVRALSPMFGA